MSRVWEKVMEKMLKKAKDIKGIKKTVSTKANLAALKYHKTGKGEVPTTSSRRSTSPMSKPCLVLTNVKFSSPEPPSDG